jgi:carboxypeptidase Q
MIPAIVDPKESSMLPMLRKMIGPMLLIGCAAAIAAQQPPGQGGGRGGAGNIVVWAPHTIVPEKIDADMNAKIRTEGMEHSKLMWIEHELTDVYGPRPIGSPNHKAAADWAVKTMTEFGMKNAHLEPFTWRGVGWLPGRTSGYITSPVHANLKFEAVPWSPSTNGAVSGEVVRIIPPETPTAAEFDRFLAEIVTRVKGRIVMVGPPPNVPVSFNEPVKRRPDDQVKAQYLPPDPNAPARGGRGGNRGGNRGNTPAPEGRLSAQEVNARITEMLRDNPPCTSTDGTGTGPHSRCHRGAKRSGPDLR